MTPNDTVVRVVHCNRCVRLRQDGEETIALSHSSHGLTQRREKTVSCVTLLAWGWGAGVHELQRCRTGINPLVAARSSLLSVDMGIVRCSTAQEL